MWLTFCARYGTWFFLILGMQNHLVRSDALNYEDIDANEENNNFGDVRRLYNGGYANSWSNQPQCSLPGLCELMSGPLRAIRSALTELEANAAAYCGNQPSLARFQPMNFPPFPSMDFMQFPPFSSFMSPPNLPVVNPPPNNVPSANSPPLNYAPPVDQQWPNSPQQEPNNNKPPSGNPWDIFTGPGSQSHKKFKVKVCSSRRSGNGKKKHAAAAMPIQKPPREEVKEFTTTEPIVVGPRAESEYRSVTSAAADIPSTTISYQEPVVNDGKEEKLD